MSRKEHPLRGLAHGGEYFLLRATMGVLGRVPRGWHPALARGLARVLTAVPLRRGVVAENLAIAFPEWSEAKRRALVPAVVENTLRLALEVAYLRRIDKGELAESVEVEPGLYAEIVAAAKETGFIFAAGHLGNWEWQGAVGTLKLGPMGVIYKPMHNARSDKFLREMREGLGMLPFSTRERNQRALLGWLRGGGVVAILIDQDARREGVFVPFFGREASTAPGMATLALRYGLPVLPAFCVRTGACKFKLVAGEWFRPDPAAGREAETMRLLNHYHRALEAAIREYPEQYFWWHRRWKTRPRDKK